MLPELIDADLKAIPFSAIDHWSSDDHQDAFASFLKTARTETAHTPHLRPTRRQNLHLLPLYQKALDHAAHNGDARTFFEDNFAPFKIEPHQGRGFLTGYYEPEILGSLEKTEPFSIPVLARPDDLVTFPQDEPSPLDGYSAARKTSQGIQPYFDRAAIWDGALNGRDLELLYLPDKVELFFAHIQGSARVRLPDGKICRLTYAGRNGHPYTTIAKVIVAEGHMSLGEINLETLKNWLRSNPEHAERLMRLNRSYIFFSRSDDLPESEGPIGAASTSPPTYFHSRRSSPSARFPAFSVTSFWPVKRWSARRSTWTSPSPTTSPISWCMDFCTSSVMITSTTAMPWRWKPSRPRFSRAWISPTPITEGQVPQRCGHAP